MRRPEAALKIFEKYSPLIDKELKRLLKSQENYAMYDMMHYFFGYKNENFKPMKVYGGKRYRSGLCMLLADIYGNMNKAIKVAAAIELFHNFTLIHDDIEDMDPLRRGRSTVWKLWGINHAINTGDGQLLLTNLELAEVAEKYPKEGVKVQKFLYEKFLEVFEGQYLDFTLTDLPLGNVFVTEKNYLTMIKKKTSVLVGASTKSAGIIIGLSEKEAELLWEFGLNFGLAYQICDDMVSIWGNSEVTGKLVANDLYEKKKTLPVIYLYNKLNGGQKQKLAKIYNKKRRLNRLEVKELISLLDEHEAYDYCWQKVQNYASRAQRSIDKLTVSRKDKDILSVVVNTLLPNIKKVRKC